MTTLLILSWCCTLVTVNAFISRSDHDFGFPHRFAGIATSRVTTSHGAALSEPTNSKYGRQDYWNGFYEKEKQFSWYAGWGDLEPFVNEFMDHKFHVIIPGVGNDKSLVEMYDAGFLHLTAMDYAPEGIERCREMLGVNRIRKEEEGPGVELLVADARELQDVFASHSFDAVLEKGTLDAIYLSGGGVKETADKHLDMAISELGRIVKPGGIWMSIAAVVVDQIQASFEERSEWEPLVGKDDLYMTDDGYTSNNIDGTLLVWRKRIK
jgi:SAM-dependent methyltransferase